MRDNKFMSRCQKNLAIAAVVAVRVHEAYTTEITVVGDVPRGCEGVNCFCPHKRKISFP